MTQEHKPDSPARLDRVETTGAKRVKGMPTVLIASTIAAIVLVGLVLVIFL